MDEISNIFRTIIVEKKQQLRLAGDMEDAIYFIYEGLIKISYFSESGREYIVTILKDGGIYSFHSEATAYALKDSLVFLISMKNFKELLVEFPFLHFRMYKELGYILKRYNDLVMDLAFREVSSRLAKYLLECFPDDDWTTHGLTVEELACHLGSARQTISTTLNRWERQGLIELMRGQMKITDREGILKLV